VLLFVFDRLRWKPYELWSTLCSSFAGLGDEARSMSTSNE
jgi:hypothetical protein